MEHPSSVRTSVHQGNSSASAPPLPPLPSSASVPLHQQKQPLAKVPVAENWCTTQVSIITFNYMWTINNFSFCRGESREMITSSTFSSSQNDLTKWYLRLSPRGLDEDSRDFVSVFLVLLHSGAKPEIYAKFRCSIITAKNEEFASVKTQCAFRFVQGMDWGFKKWISREMLLDPANDLLANDRLTIFCEIQMVGDTAKSVTSARNMIHVPEPRLADDLFNLFENGQLTDLVVAVIAPEKEADHQLHPKLCSDVRSSSDTGPCTSPPISQNVDRVPTATVKEPSEHPQKPWFPTAALLSSSTKSYSSSTASSDCDNGTDIPLRPSSSLNVSHSSECQQNSELRDKQSLVSQPNSPPMSDAPVASLENFNFSRQSTKSCDQLEHTAHGPTKRIRLELSTAGNGTQEVTRVSPTLQPSTEAVCTSTNSADSTTHARRVVLREFHVHKAILAARSPTFADIFRHTIEKGVSDRVEISDVAPDTMADMLHFIYTAKVVVKDVQRYCDLLKAAMKYQLPRLQLICQDMLVRNLNVDNCCALLQFADAISADVLKVHCIEFIFNNVQVVLEMDLFVEMIHKKPHLLLEMFKKLALRQSSLAAADVSLAVNSAP